DVCSSDLDRARTTSSSTIRMSLMSGPRRYCQCHGNALFGPVLQIERAAKAFRDPTTESKAHAKARGLGRLEGHEELFDLFFAQTGAGVRDFDCKTATRSGLPADSQQATGFHGLDSVGEDRVQNLLQLGRARGRD